jgi:mRNA (2'-O-methyladenosine-N6-)-methyltransferase
MDPPWQLAGAAPTRGVAIGYKQLGNKAIEEIPIPKLQKKGFLFIWVINARYSFAVEMMERWGYK